MVKLDSIKGFCKDYLLFSNLVKTNINYGQVYIFLYNISKKSKKVPFRFIKDNVSFDRVTLYNVLSDFVNNGLLIKINNRGLYHYYIIINKDLFIRSTALSALKNIESSNKVEFIT